MNRQIELAYKIALLYEGEKEIPGSKNNPNIVDFHKATTLRATDDETPHCASAMNFMQIQACLIINPGLTTRCLANRGMDKDIPCFLEHAIRNCEELNLKSELHSLKFCDYTKNKNQLSNGLQIELPTFSALARSFEKFGVATDMPEIGDVVVFSRRSDNSGSGHVGWWSGWSGNENRSVYCYGSNQSNNFCFANYEIERVISYRTLK
jgi:hypothetical protein